jgi:hypothetical protein
VSIQEARALAWGHNVDNEFRSSMTTIQRINYLHMRYLENNRKGDMTFKMDCVGEIQLRNWGIEDDKHVLNANDNLFQLAFRENEIWNGVAKNLHKWEEGRIKGQKQAKVSKTDPKGIKNAILESRPSPMHMKMIEWRHMQPLKDASIVVPVLERVALGELSLQEMGHEFKRLKYLRVVQRAFLTCLNKIDWEDCKIKYPYHCTDKILNNFVTSFST